jgi:Trk-type K+ transport system membrane component
MMYVSVYPVAMSIRRTNVYEEKSLGLYLPDDDENESLLGFPPENVD